MKKTQLALCFIVAGLLAANQFTRAAEPNHPDQPIVSLPEALSRLKEGNGRFISGNVHPHESSEERAYMAKNSYENAGVISLGMTSEQAAKRRTELIKSQHPVVGALRSSTPILKARVDSGDVQVIGCYYTLDTGTVTFLDEE
jgi:carbonic anhydrase